MGGANVFRSPLRDSEMMLPPVHATPTCMSSTCSSASATGRQLCAVIKSTCGLSDTTQVPARGGELSLRCGERQGCITDQVAAGDSPHFDGLVRAHRGELGAVGGECHISLYSVSFSFSRPVGREATAVDAAAMLARFVLVQLADFVAGFAVKNEALHVVADADEEVAAGRKPKALSRALRDGVMRWHARDT
jgi:hypothetical protein